MPHRPSTLGCVTFFVAVVVEMDLRAVLTELELLDSKFLPVCVVCRAAPFFLLQDLYLHQFFQHCQIIRSTSEGNPAELIKYLKVSQQNLLSSNNYQQS